MFENYKKLVKTGKIYVSWLKPFDFEIPRERTPKKAVLVSFLSMVKYIPSKQSFDLEGLGAASSTDNKHHRSPNNHASRDSPRRSTNITFQDDNRILHTRRLTVVDPNPAILAAAASRKVTKESLFQRLASVIPPPIPIPSSESSGSRESRLQSKESLYTGN
uniref:Uncharacterized protein n=1 Tax=Panagrolaimus sp. PS1159 TaxID=55785 RepID=A0AC35G3A9_9BILA